MHWATWFAANENLSEISPILFGRFTKVMALLYSNTTTPLHPKHVMCIYVVACVTLNIEFIHMVIQLHSKIDIFNAINVELNTRTILAKIQNSYGANNQFNKPSNGMRHSVPISMYVCVCICLYCHWYAWRCRFVCIVQFQFLLTFQTKRNGIRCKLCKLTWLTVCIVIAKQQIVTCKS